MTTTNEKYSIRANAEYTVATVALATRVGLEASMGGEPLHIVWPYWLRNTAADFQNLYTS